MRLSNPAAFRMYGCWKCTCGFACLALSACVDVGRVHADLLVCRIPYVRMLEMYVWICSYAVSACIDTEGKTSWGQKKRPHGMAWGTKETPPWHAGLTKAIQINIIKLTV